MDVISYEKFDVTDRLQSSNSVGRMELQRDTTSATYRPEEIMQDMHCTSFSVEFTQLVMIVGIFGITELLHFVHCLIF
jgi:hypothetical protein